MSNSNDSMVGRQIDEYQIDKPLGAGGMARVYRALDTRLQRYVALKVIAPHFRTDSDYTSRFGREAQSIARLEHPNIVHIYRFGEVNGLYYIAMQYVEGATISALIEDYKRNNEVMPVADVLRVIQDMAAALDYVHSRNIIHRDVKPDNLIVSNQGQSILTDFGLALLSDIGTQGEIFGSPSYISPEQAISSDAAVPQSDLYSLGVTLFEMLTGDLPFTGSEPMSIAMRHVSDPPPRPSQLNKNIPAAIDTVVLRCLEKEPHNRYQSGAEMSVALQQVVDAWQTNKMAPETARQPSLVMIPQKVHDLVAAAPLPAIPESKPLAPLPVSSVTIPPVSFALPTQPAVAAKTLPARRKNSWRTPLLLALSMFVVGYVGLILLILAAQRNNPSNVALGPTLTDTATATPTPPAPIPSVQSTDVPPEIPTPTALVLPTTAGPAMASPTAAPTLIPVSATSPSTAIIITLAPTSLLPTALAIVPMPMIIPPNDRSIIPPGSIRLGVFTVEHYCNDRGYGVILINNQSAWACTNLKNKQVVSILGAPDFDNICRTQYNNLKAFALLDQHQNVQAYNWSCYLYNPPPIVVPTSIPTTSIATPLTIITPSTDSLMLSDGPDWVALINISDSALSLGSIRFSRDNRTLTAADWGVSALLPRQCLRIYKDKPPHDLPSNCATRFDYPGKPEDRHFWLEGRVNILIDSSIKYCYPKKCAVD